MSMWNKKDNDPNTAAPRMPAVTSAPKAPDPKPTTAVVPHMESTCPDPGVFGAVDLCQTATQHFLDVMKYLGVKTIIRYYDYQHESLVGKTPPVDSSLVPGRSL